MQRNMIEIYEATEIFEQSLGGILDPIPMEHDIVTKSKSVSQSYSYSRKHS